MKFSKNTALILIDCQAGFADPYWGERNNPQAEENIAQMLTTWRERGWPVFHVRHHSRSEQSPLHPSKPGAAFMPELAPRDGEPVITKDVNSAFIGTDLREQLQGRGIKTLVFAGLTSDHCVSTSVRMAGNYDFEVYLLQDACATFGKTGPDGQYHTAQMLHEASMASLHGEFATVLNTSDILALDKAPAFR